MCSLSVMIQWVGDSLIVVRGCTMLLLCVLQEALSDVELKIGDARFFAHKFVLAKSSDVFRTMLYERNWSQVGPNAF